MTKDQVAHELVAVVKSTSDALRAIDETIASSRPAPDKWCGKEIIGHLIDSAANNHHRFVRAQQDSPLVFPKYDQEHWVNSQHYTQRPWIEIIELWVAYNLHLAHVIARIDHDAWNVICVIGEYEPVTLSFLVEDYLVHLKHHIRQILPD